MRALSFPLVAAAILAGCSTAPEQRSARAQADLDQALAGRVAQAPVNCLPRFSSDNLIVVDDGTLLFREGRTLYRNDFNGGSCSGLRSGHTLVTNQQGRLCRGDIAQVVNLQTGSMVGSCIIGEFTPYTLPGR
jgi:hypothetical protein